jgi:hypothetical protein
VKVRLHRIDVPPPPRKSQRDVPLRRAMAQAIKLRKRLVDEFGFVDELPLAAGHRRFVFPAASCKMGSYGFLEHVLLALSELRRNGLQIGALQMRTAS